MIATKEMPASTELLTGGNGSEKTSELIALDSTPKFPKTQIQLTTAETLGYITRVGALLRIDSDGALVVAPGIPDDLQSAIIYNAAELMRFLSELPEQTYPAKVIQL